MVSNKSKRVRERVTELAASRYNLRMENATLNCQTCLRPILAEGTQQQSQWNSVCRCDRAYTPGSSFSIDVCVNCKMRVAAVGRPAVPCRGLCACEQPNPKKVPTYLKQNQTDEVSLDLASLGMSDDTFPTARYAPLALLGNGQRATTVLARDRQRGTKVAVKCFKTIAQNMRPTFESEVRKNKELNHTNIAKIADFGYQNNKTPYLVTEYREGFNVEQCLALYGTPSHDVAIHVLIGICEALLYAQKQGVLHRNIRAANVIFLDDLNSQPSIAVLDFAMPKIKDSQELVDPYDALYLSGDDARNLEYTEKSDMYSVGAVGFALLTASPPFTADTALDIKNMHALKLPPKISDLKFDNTRPKELEEIIERCLEKDPRYRFDSIEKLLERLEAFPRREKQRIAEIENARKRKKLALTVGCVVLVSAACAAGYFMFGHH